MEYENIKIEIKQITPELAQELLSRNMKNNRSISKKAVDAIAASIERGEWIFNGQPIVIDEDGNLQDGQHRILAVLKTKKPIDSLVVSGVSRDAYIEQNGSRQQTLSDVTRYNEVKNNKTVSSIVRSYLNIVKGRMASHNAVRLDTGLSNRFMFDTYKENAEVFDILASEYVKNRNRTSILGSGDYGLGAYLIINKFINKRKVIDFYDVVTDFTRFDIQSASLLREVLRKNSESTLKMQEKYRLKYLYKAMFYHLNGKEIKRLYVSNDEIVGISIFEKI